MLHPYIAVALLSATYEVDSDDFTYGSIPGLPAVNATGATFSACRQQLRIVLEQHVISQLQAGENLPVLHGVLPPTAESELRRQDMGQLPRRKRASRRLGY